MAAADELTVSRTDTRMDVALNRPSARNALNMRLLSLLDGALAEARDDPDVRVVVLRGAGGKAFSTGADLKELHALGAAEALDALRLGQRVLRRVETLEKPVVAVVDGYALGGGFELCLAASLVVAGEQARFGLPEAGLGLIPGFGGTQRLVRAVGKHRALRVMLAGDVLAADEAFALGLLSYPPVPSGDLENQVEEVVTQVAAKSPEAMRAILAAVDHAAHTPLAAGLESETHLAWMARESADGAEGVRSFFEKRPPRFTGLRVGGRVSAASEEHS